MANISVSAAAGAGFRLIGRSPLVLLGWGLFVFVVGVLPVFGMFVWVGPIFGDLIRQAIAHPTTPPVMDAFPRMSSMMALNPVIQLVSMVMRVVLCAAVFRAVLDPKQRSFAYLRLGMREVWLALLYLSEAILLAVLIIALAIPAGVIIGLSFAFLAHWAAALVVVVVAFAALVGLIWVLLRFSMAGPMTYADNEFRLFESWAITRGHALQLLGLSLLVFLILMLVQMVVGAVFGLSMLAVLASMGFQIDRLMTFFQQSPQIWIPQAAPYVVIAGLVGSVMIAAYDAIMLAPYAAFYRMLRPSGDETVARADRPFALDETI